MISTPNYFDSLTYLPYVHALLKTFCEKDPVVLENYNWFEPIFLNDAPERLLAGREASIDVLGLSCYLWNWPLQLEIAQRVRKANPNCLIIMGGPHPDWKDQDFFTKYPDIDIVVKNEGEQPFCNILLEYLKAAPDYRQISSLILPDPASKTIHTGAALRITEWNNQSVWQTEDMKQIATKYSAKTKLGVVWETNRGCPYHCSFCDWGSATYSKIRSLPVERLEEDLKFFAQNKIAKIFIADSNFGMFPRDLELAKRVVHYKEAYGYPSLVHWSTAKNIAEPLIEIAKAFLDHGLDDSVVVSMQSANESTVVEMGRGAHSLKVHKKFSGMIDELGAPKVGQIILGSPGETCEQFMDSLNEVLELNFHRALFIMNYAVLPNAPITQPETMQKHQIKTISRPANRTWGHKTTLWKWKAGEETIIVGHNQMNSEDWVKMSLYKTHIMCLHNLGLTRLVSRVFKNIMKVSYADFYKYLFEEALVDSGFVGEQYRFVQEHFRDYLVNDEAIYALQGIDPDWYIDHESALF
ncbi:MAG: radical SAM protein, partial [Bdellovibrionaceae bacterium]|nr:radical SAM protein [Pseudobdellovibrionaceae bacterium]